MKQIYKYIVLLVFSVLATSSMVAQVENHDVRVGNKSYNAKNYTIAEQKYRSALSKNDHSFYGNYNLANTLYRKNDLQTARNYYQKALLFATNKFQRAEVYHNVGTSFLKEKKYKDAVDALKKSMIANPNSEDTRRQLAYAMRMEKRERNQNPPPPNAGDKKMEDDSLDNNRQILESLDEEDENHKPNAGGQANVKNW